jgi:hypothetical protein
MEKVRYTRKNSRQEWNYVSNGANGSHFRPIVLSKVGDEKYTIDVTVEDFEKNFKEVA